MDTLLILKAFIETANTGSFSEAARRLGVTPSIIAKRINDLEARGRQPLFRRTTREVTLTDSGKRHLPVIRSVVSELEGLLIGMKQPEGDLEGHLRVAAPPALSRRYLSKIYRALQDSHPRISMDIVVISQPVNPMDENFDLVIGGFLTSYEGVNEIPLCPMNMVLCASPDYLERRGKPSQPRDLYEHSCLHNSMSAVPTGVMWSFTGRRGVSHVEIRPSLVSNDTELLLTAACVGSGVVILPDYVAADALKSGELVRLLEDHELPTLSVNASIPKRQTNPEQVQLLLERITDALTPVP